MSLEKRSIRGAIAAGTSVAVSVGQNIILLPILLNHWGKTRYAAWVAISAGAALVLSLDAGHHNYVGGEFNKDFATNPVRVRETLASALRVAVIVGALEVLLAGAISIGGLMPRFAGVDPAVAAENSLGLAFFILVSLAVLPFTLGGILNRIYAPAGRFEEAQWWNVAARVFQTLAIVVVAYAGGGIVAAAFLSTAVVMAVMLASVVSLRRTFASLWPFWGGGSLRLGFRNLLRSLVLTATQWLLQLQSNFLVVVVAATLGDTATAIFATLRTIANAFIQGMQVLFLPLAPEAIRFALTAEHRKLRELLCAAWLVGGLIINLSLLAAVPLLAPLYKLWTRGLLRFELGLFLALATAVSLRAIGAPVLNILVGINDLRAQVVIAAVQASTVLALAFSLLRGHGVVAAGWAIAAGEAIGSIGLPVLFLDRRLRETGGAFPRTAFLAPLGSTASLVAAFVGISYGLDMALTLAAAAIATVACQFSLWRLLEPATKMRILRLVRLGKPGAPQ